MAAMTKTEQLLRIKDEFRKAHENKPASAAAMIDWATKVGLYAIDEAAARRRGARELAEALRSETIVDDHGNDVRVGQPFETEEGWLWDDIRTISHGHMEISVAHTRNRIVGEVKAAAASINFYNNFHPDRPPIQTSFNFENDLKDAGIPLPDSVEDLIGSR